MGGVGASSLQSTPYSHNFKLFGPLKQADNQHEVCHCLSGTTPDFTAIWTVSFNRGTNALKGTIIMLNTFMCPNPCVISNNDKSYHKELLPHINFPQD
jgi:hypothetical protein